MWTYKRKYKHKPVTKLKLRHQWQLLKTKLVILKENVELQKGTYKRKYKHNPDFPPSYRLWALSWPNKTNANVIVQIGATHRLGSKQVCIRLDLSLDMSLPLPCLFSCHVPCPVDNQYRNSGAIFKKSNTIHCVLCWTRIYAVILLCSRSQDIVGIPKIRGLIERRPEVGQKTSGSK